MEDKLLNRVRMLLAKAESTDSPHEAEALTEKAEALILEHALDLSKPVSDSEVISKRWTWFDYKAIGKRRLVLAVAAALPGTYAIYHLGGGVRGAHSVSVWTDDPMKLHLIDSLLIQGETALAFWWVGCTPQFKGSGMYAKKNNYLWGFGRGAASRFATQVATASLDESKALVLANASRRVEQFAKDEINAPLSRGRGAPRSNPLAGYMAGVTEGQRADTGGKMIGRG